MTQIRTLTYNTRFDDDDLRTHLLSQIDRYMLLFYAACYERVEADSAAATFTLYLADNVAPCGIVETDLDDIVEKFADSLLSVTGADNGTSVQFTSTTNLNGVGQVRYNLWELTYRSQPTNNDDTFAILGRNDTTIILADNAVTGSGGMPPYLYDIVYDFPDNIKGLIEIYEDFTPFDSGGGVWVTPITGMYEHIGAEDTNQLINPLFTVSLQDIIGTVTAGTDVLMHTDTFRGYKYDHTIVAWELRFEVEESVEYTIVAKITSATLTLNYWERQFYAADGILFIDNVHIFNGTLDLIIPTEDDYTFELLLTSTADLTSAVLSGSILIFRQ